MNRKFMVHWMGNIRNGDFYDEKKEGTLLASGSPALCKSAALRLQPHGGRTGYQVRILFNTVISVSIYENGSEELLDDCFALAQKYEGYFPIRFRTAIFPKSTMRAALP